MTILFDMLNNKEVFDMKNRVAQVRRSKSMTQEEVSLAAGITRSTLSLVETGNQNPSIEVALKISNALDCSLNDLFFNVDVGHDKQEATI